MNIEPRENEQGMETPAPSGSDARARTDTPGPDPSPIATDSPESGDGAYSATAAGESVSPSSPIPSAAALGGSDTGAGAASQPSPGERPVGGASREGDLSAGDASAESREDAADNSDSEDSDSEDSDVEDSDVEDNDVEDDDVEDDDDDEDEDVGPVEPIEEAAAELPPEEMEFRWYILKVQVNREDSIREALQRRIARAGLDPYFGDIVVPTEDVVEFNKNGKKRTVKRKLYPGYIIVNMALTEETWFLVRETPGIGDFTGSAGKPTPMDPDEVRRIIKPKGEETEGAEEVRIAIPFNVGDRVRVKEGYFQNFEGDVESIDNANGRVTVMINIFGRSTPVELQHWQMERV